eukprot:gene32736-42390_t
MDRIWKGFVFVQNVLASKKKDGVDYGGRLDGRYSCGQTVLFQIRSGI